MIKFIQDVNAHTEEQDRYKSDNVILKLDEDTFRVTVYPASTAGVALSGVNPIVDITKSDLDSAIVLYNKLAEQLSEGDVIRNL